MCCWNNRERGEGGRQSGAVKWKMKRLLEKNAGKYARKAAKVAKVNGEGRKLRFIYDNDGYRQIMVMISEWVREK